MKRAFDFAASLVLLVIFLPVLAALSVAVLASDGSPVLFRQVRVGRGLKRFRILKFRTMRSHPEGSGATPEGATPEELQALRKAFQTTAKNDPRVTSIGRFLRKSSLDELPQLVNVLWGDMSLVGPRPDTPVQEADYAPADWVERHKVRPGITGLAQIRGRSELGFDEQGRDLRLLADLEYVRTRSFAGDLRILFVTALQLLRLRGNA